MGLSQRRQWLRHNYTAAAGCCVMMISTRQPRIATLRWDARTQGGNRGQSVACSGVTRFTSATPNWSPSGSPIHGCNVELVTVALSALIPNADPRFVTLPCCN